MLFAKTNRSVICMTAYAIASSWATRRGGAMAFTMNSNRFGRAALLTTEPPASALAKRRRRPPPNTDNLYKKLYPAEHKYSLSLALRATRELEEDETEVVPESDWVEFPLTGMRVEDCPPRLRFAPSPTGSLHVGGARTALYNYLLAKKGQLDFPHSKSGFVLRVEDTDVARSTKESEESVLKDLRWLGLIWDEGPDDPDADFGPYRQSERGDLYKKLANKLISEGKGYPCFSTKEELEAVKEKQEAEGIPPRYDGTWRDADPVLVQEKMDNGDPYTVRFKVPPSSRVVIDDGVRGTVSWDADATVGDFILLRSSGIPVYNFCVAVDDATMGITTVVRAEEHLTNTLRQALILDALGAPRPKYAHCSLILGEDKNKLSKRHGATSCDDFRLQGFLPEAMINYLSLLGWNDGTDNEIFTRDELIEGFDLSRVIKSPAVFDIQKLKWINSQHLKRLSFDEVKPLVRDQLQMNNILAADHDQTVQDNFITASTALAKQMMETTKDAVTNAVTVLDYNLPDSYDKMVDREAKAMIKMGHFYRISKGLIAAFRGNEMPMPDPVYPLSAFSDPKQSKTYQPNVVPITDDAQQGGGAYSYPSAYKIFMKELTKEYGVKGKCLFHPVRLALTGEMSGQDVPKQMTLLLFQDAVNRDNDTVNIVTMEQRMERLEAFLETIPEEFRAPLAKDVPTDNTKTSKQPVKKESTISTYSKDSSDAIDYYGPPITALDIRVGYIKNAYEHPEAEKLFCEEIDVGEEELRTVASGLRSFYDSPAELIGRKVLVVCNLKARKMMGFQSHGMVLCASNEDHSIVKVVSAPVDANVGERVTLVGMDFSEDDAAPWKENKIGKKKVMEKIIDSGFFKTSSDTGTVCFGNMELLTSAGVCTSAIRDGGVS